MNQDLAGQALSHLFSVDSALGALETGKPYHQNFQMSASGCSPGYFFLEHQLDAPWDVP